jgi:hypothetical protein
MKTNATTLRKMVLENRWTAGKLSEAQLGSKDDYTELSKSYKDCLEALTEWAGKDYVHTSKKSDLDNAFAKAKAILELFATEEDRIIIDNASLRTLRDFAVKPKRMYSENYKKAMKLLKLANATVTARLEDLKTLGVEVPEEVENFDTFVQSVKDSGINTTVGTVDMLEMLVNAHKIAEVREQAVEDVKSAGNWTWKRPAPVNPNEFAELVENYIGDCLEDGFNLKSYKATTAEDKALNKKLNEEVKAMANA